MIRYEDVEVRFGDTVALPAFALDIREGEFFTLLGPSGCGKTTALRVLAGLVPAARGRVLVGGRDVTSLRSDQRDLGMVFQNYALFPSMTVRENIAFGLKVRRAPAAEVRSAVLGVARQVDLTEDQLDRSVAELSGGQQQRVAIARSLVMRPRILLLDEPLSNLDAQLRRQLRVQLKELQRQIGVTTVYVTHDQEEALTMSDRVAVLRDGRIEQVGTPEEVYARSATEFVCTFLGDADRLTPGLAARLGADPAGATYVRAEKVALHEAGTPVPGAVDGTVRTRQYHGTGSTYEVDCGADGTDGTVRALVIEDGRAGHAVGDRVQVVVRREHLLQYPAPGDAGSPANGRQAAAEAVA